jgi:hypothetical protein
MRLVLAEPTKPVHKPNTFEVHVTVASSPALEDFKTLYFRPFSLAVGSEDEEVLASLLATLKWMLAANSALPPFFEEQPYALDFYSNVPGYASWFTSYSLSPAQYLLYSDVAFTYYQEHRRLRDSMFPTSDVIEDKQLLVKAEVFFYDTSLVEYPVEYEL